MATIDIPTPSDAADRPAQLPASSSSGRPCLPADDGRTPAQRGAGAFFWLATAAAISTYLLIVAGAVVRVTGSGDGCGPDWPTCRGQIIPPLDPAALIEFTHRFVAAATSTLIVAVPVAAWLWRRERRILLPATLIPVLLACQIVLGAIVVWMGLPPMAVLVHLGFAMLILGGMVWIAVQAAPRPRAIESGPARPHYVPLLGVTAAAIFVLILTGAYTRATGASGACAGFPGCTVPVAAVEALEQAAPAGPLGLVGIHLLHRVTAYVVSVVVAAAVAETWRLRRGVPALRNAAGLLLTFLVAQDAAGAAAASTGLPTGLRGAHVAGAAAVWASSILLFALARRLPTSAIRIPSAPAARERVSRGVGVREKLRAYYRLTKPKVILLLEVPTLAAMLVAGHDLPSPALVVATLLGGALAAGGAAAINSYIDRDIDAVMGSRTQARPIPAGVVSAGEALAFGLALAVASFAVLAIFANLLAAFLAQAALLVYVFVYTVWLKRSTPSNIVIGGAAGAIPPLVGWAAVTGDVGPVAWLLFAIIFFWTPPHFWALALIIRQHYARANVPMLPVVRGDAETRRQIVYYTLQMIAVTVLLFAFGLSGLFYFWSALVLGGVFLYLAARLWREATTRAASRLFHYSMLYLWLLCAALVLDKRLFS